MSSTKVQGHLWHDLHKWQYLAQELIDINTTQGIDTWKGDK
jgi:hypothetical protein